MISSRRNFQAIETATFGAASIGVLPRSSKSTAKLTWKNKKTSLKNTLKVSIRCFLKFIISIVMVYLPLSAQTGDDPDGHVTPKPNIELADGQGGDLLSEEEEESPGAFTVANKNDSDDDGKIDDGDNAVDEEKDLMKVVLNPPSPSEGVKDDDTLTLTMPGQTELWENETKDTKVSERTWKVKDLPKTFWVEVTEESGSIRDKEFVWKYDKNGEEDKAKATAVWATLTKATVTGNVVPPNLDDARLANGVRSLGMGILTFNGNHPHIGAVWIRQAGILFEFKTEPSGLENEDKVKFDITRQMEARQATFFNGQWLVAPSATFPNGDLPNDDSGQGDEDVIPKNGDIYSADWPGTVSLRPKPADGTESVVSLNFNEFVRVSVGKNTARPTEHQSRATGQIVDAGKDGSRCSDKEKWFVKLWVEMANGTLVSKAGKRNAVVPGSHDPVNQH